MPKSLSGLLEQIRTCRLCEAELPLGARPVLQAHRNARILVVGQAPGTKVHETGLPFNDPSGERLRDWLGVDRQTFYDAEKIALVPMGFCYPGRGRSGDLPPDPRCAATWRRPLLAGMPDIELTVVLGKYAIGWHLPEWRKHSIAEVARHWQDFAPGLVPAPHPSPRNNLWLRQHPWFEAEVVPFLRTRVSSILHRTV